MKVGEAPALRVLHPITRLIVGGAQENTLYTAERLDARRFQVEVLCGAEAGPEGTLIDEARQRGIALRILPDLVRQASPVRDLRALVALRRLMRAEHYAIVHTHSSKAGILGRLAAVLAGTPVVIHTVHGWSFHDYMSPLTRWTYILFERLCARFADALVAVSKHDIEKGLAAGIGKPEQYCLIRSAIPLDEFNPDLYDRRASKEALGLPPDAPVVGNVGRFSLQKNPLEWVAVAARVASTRPDVHFILVGDGPLRPEVEAALNVNGLRERTVLTGLRRDIPALLSAMDVFLLTSRWEGLPRVLPQAMAMGLPVVASRADGSAEAVRDGASGYLCAPGQVEALAACCVQLLDHPAEGRTMGALGREVALAEFGLDSMVTKLEILYDRAVEGARPTPGPPL